MGCICGKKIDFQNCICLERHIVYIRYGLLNGKLDRGTLLPCSLCDHTRPLRMSKSNENRSLPSGESLLGGPLSPQSQAKLCAEKQALILSGKDQVLPTGSETLTQQTTAAMAYSAPGRYAGVLQALEALRVDLDTAPLPALIALVRSIDSDLADRATTELWDRDRLLITMRDEELPLPQRVDAPIAAAAHIPGKHTELQDSSDSAQEVL